MESHEKENPKKIDQIFTRNLIRKKNLFHYKISKNNFLQIHPFLPMDKDEDYGIYDGQFLNEANSSPKRKILQTRILKLSLYESDSVYGRIGAELLRSGQFQKSVTWLKRATIVRPYDTDALINLATAFFKLEKEDEAFSFIKKELSEGSNLHRFLIEALEEKNKLQDLESFSKEIVDTIEDPESIPYFYYYIAEALVHHDKYPEALVNFQKAFENNSSMRQYHHEEYGLALYHEGFFEEALIQFEHVRSLNPTIESPSIILLISLIALEAPRKLLKALSIS